MKGQTPTKERKVPQGGLVFQHVNALVGIGPKFLMGTAHQVPSACAVSYEPWPTHPNDRRW
jgi:hypothetical protein